MRSEENAPLPLGLWLSELGRLGADCAEMPAESEDRAVRKGFHLFKLAPASVRSIADPYLPESVAESLLEQGKAVEAVELFLGTAAAYELRPEQEGPGYLAILAYDGGAPVSATGASRALALVGAWTKFLTRG